MNETSATSEIAAAALTSAAAQVGARLNVAAQALDEIARARCLLALDEAAPPESGDALGRRLVDAADQIRRLAVRAEETLIDLQSRLQTGDGEGYMARPPLPTLEDAVAAYVAELSCAG